MFEETFDVVVIGGGPGGSTAASFIAMQGHRVLLLERESFPRHQIGESLLPVTIHGICKMLGVEDEIHAAGFMRKRGGTLRWGKKQEPWTFDFEDAWMLSAHGAGYSYQVERDRFDQILLDNTRKKGVDVREQCRVRDVMRDDATGRIAGVRYLDAEGHERRIGARFVIDAGGHTSRLHEYCGQRVFAKYFQNIALYAYYEHGARLPEPNQGNILAAAFKDGWFWYIPLTPTLTSVGAVVSREHYEETLRLDPDEAMRRFIDACPLIKEYLARATRVTEGKYGSYRIRKDYSYCNTQFWAPGLLLVGDAACFIDPVFSSGVHLATYAALLASRTVNTVLAGGADELRCLEEFERRYRKEYAAFYDFLVGFYDMEQDQDSYFWGAKRVVGSDEDAERAFVRLVAGAATTAEDFAQMRGEKREFMRDYVASRTNRERPEDFFGRYAGKAFDGPKMIRQFREAREQIVAQASRSGARGPEQVPAEGGLVPSFDGFHWAEPGPA